MRWPHINRWQRGVFSIAAIILLLAAASRMMVPEWQEHQPDPILPFMLAVLLLTVAASSNREAE